MPSLSSAANFDDITQAEQCIANGDNVNEICAFGYTPLLIAANHNALQVAALLIANGANVNYLRADSITPTPLHRAIDLGNARFARLLLNSGADLTL